MSAHMLNDAEIEAQATRRKVEKQLRMRVGELNVSQLVKSMRTVTSGQTRATLPGRVVRLLAAAIEHALTEEANHGS